MITKRTKYALKALEELAQNYTSARPILISDLAKNGRIPKKFLELILLDLKNKRILDSKKGKGGGYLLAKRPDQIKLGEVLRILEGPLAPLPCLSVTAYRKCDECTNEATCNIRLIMKDIHDFQVRLLDNTTLQDMIEKNKHLEEIGVYQI
ncbi:MAG TPA: Rrf2 family transcriptional regulator [Candidatus Omnitrophota bacterium]|nr:Rrf2 family transcriptional regulator [Candidatus Omnitrophota bacterium]